MSAHKMIEVKVITSDALVGGHNRATALVFKLTRYTAPRSDVTMRLSPRRLSDLINTHWTSSSRFWLMLFVNTSKSQSLRPERTSHASIKAPRWFGAIYRMPSRSTGSTGAGAARLARATCGQSVSVMRAMKIKLPSFMFQLDETTLQILRTAEGSFPSKFLSELGLILHSNAAPSAWVILQINRPWRPGFEPVVNIEWDCPPLSISNNAALCSPICHYGLIPSYLDRRRDSNSALKKVIVRLRRGAACKESHRNEPRGD